MSQVMRISENLYRRLEKHARGFDSPANVIERVLAFYEQNHGDAVVEEPQASQLETPASLDIVYHPGPESAFKEALLEKKRAYVRRFRTDGTSDDKVWNAQKFSTESRVKGNLMTGYLRGWREKGIYKAVVTVDEADLDLENNQQ